VKQDDYALEYVPENLLDEVERMLEQENREK